MLVQHPGALRREAVSNSSKVFISNPGMFSPHPHPDSPPPRAGDIFGPSNMISQTVGALVTRGSTAG